ncbi:MAG: hypothetical protein C4530_16155 [Desulfobacteraceae bacterium]|nr:MAG: hypothetical protein C4530_16155 [Desulfobacteraceae bacterium]
MFVTLDTGSWHWKFLLSDKRSLDPFPGEKGKGRFIILKHEGFQISSPNLPYYWMIAKKPL